MGDFEISVTIVCSVCNRTGRILSYHYGADEPICKACKGFFYLGQKLPALSPNGNPFRMKCTGECDVGFLARTKCRYCRMEKCLQAGMIRKREPKKTRLSSNEVALKNPAESATTAEVKGNLRRAGENALPESKKAKTETEVPTISELVAALRTKPKNNVLKTKNSN